MNLDSSTAPTRPPPGPYRPGSLTFGCDGSSKPRPSFSPQQAVASVSSPDSSKVITMSPPACRPGTAVIRGIHTLRNRLACGSPPFAPFWQRGVSCASAQVSGVMKE